MNGTSMKKLFALCALIFVSFSTVNAWEVSSPAKYSIIISAIAATGSLAAHIATEVLERQITWQKENNPEIVSTAPGFYENLLKSVKSVRSFLGVTAATSGIFALGATLGTKSQQATSRSQFVLTALNSRLQPVSKIKL